MLSGQYFADVTKPFFMKCCREHVTTSDLSFVTREILEPTEEKRTTEK